MNIMQSQLNEANEVIKYNHDHAERMNIISARDFKEQTKLRTLVDMLKEN